MTSRLASPPVHLPELAPRAGEMRWSGAIASAVSRSFRCQRAACFGALLLAGIVLVAAAGAALPAVRGSDPTRTDYEALNEGPSPEHVLGTDQLGRDNWSRLLAGTRFSLEVGVGAEAVAVVIGFGLGMAAALGGKCVDQGVVWLCDLAYALPELLLVLLLRQVLFGRDLPVIGSGSPQIPGFPGALLVTIVAISFASWATTCRLVRAQAITLRNAEFVLAARATGASEWRVAVRHLLPNTLSPLLVAISFGVPARIFAEASLGFLGLGVAPPFASLGTLVSDGYQRIHVNSLLVIWPCATVALLMLCFTLIGDGLRDALDPARRNARG